MARRRTPVLWCRLVIGSVTVTVVRRSPTPEERKKKEPAGFDSTGPTIWVSDELSEDNAWAWLFHEVTHATAYILGIDFPEEVDEKLTNAICGTQFDTLIRNGWLKLPTFPPGVRRRK